MCCTDFGRMMGKRSVDRVAGDALEQRRGYPSGLDVVDRAHAAPMAELCFTDSVHVEMTVDIGTGDDSRGRAQFLDTW